MTLFDTTVAEGRVPGATPLAVEPEHQGWRVLLRDRTAVFGLGVVALLSLAAVLAPLLAPHNPNAVDAVNKLAAPSLDHPLGTDHLGRDNLSRLLFGARLTIGTAVVASAAVAGIGIVLGVLAGYFGGVVDAVISRVIDILLAFPTFLVALAVTGALGPGLGHVAISLIVVWWARYARIVRSAVIAERAKPYVEAARAVGTPRSRTVVSHVLPNIIAPVVVLTTLDTGDLLLGISALSFLGLGVQPPAAEWGAMLSEARTYLSSDPLLMLWPGLALFLMVLGFNLLGDGLRDVLDPRTRRR
ncbi:MAG TPA: nickel transporter permease [Acidimicrobiales bacterium]|nr:nickel transporter permease [Acidimicrobiales bacterium]